VQPNGAAMGGVRTRSASRAAATATSHRPASSPPRSPSQPPSPKRHADASRFAHLEGATDMDLTPEDIASNLGGGAPAGGSGGNRR
jgi:hypothetical protein